MTRLFSALFLTIVASHAMGQCDSLSLVLGDTQCQANDIVFTNYDSTLSTYNWTVDAQVFDTLPAPEDLGNLGSTISRRDLSLIEHEGNWFGFHLSDAANALYRLEFGNSLSNTPSVHAVNTGTFPNDNSTVDGNLEVIQDNGQWALFGVARTSNMVVRYILGDSLTSDTAQTVAFLNPFGQINGFPTDVKMVVADTAFYLFVSTTESELICYDMTSDPLNSAPVAFHTTLTNTLSPAAIDIRSLEVIHTCGKFVVFVSTLSTDNVVRLIFNDPFAAPSSVDEIGPSFAWDNPYGLSLHTVNEEYFLYAHSRVAPTGATYMVSAGKNLTTNPSSWNTEQMPQFGGSLLSQNLTIARDDSGTYLFKTTIASSKLYRHFQANTSVQGNAVTEDISTIDLQNLDTGWHVLGLKAIDSTGQFYLWSDSMYLAPSPAVDFVASGACFGYPTQFNVSDSTGLGITWHWDFGEGTSFDTTDTAIQFTYNDTGHYQLEVQAISASCTNTFQTSWTINPTPVSSFSADSTCAGVPVPFSNTSSISAGSIDSHLWSFDNNDSALAFEPLYSYPDSGSFDVVLITTSDSGCSDTSTTALFIKESPIAEFELENTCLGDTTHFPNSIFSSFSYSLDWNFGDGTFSTSNQPQKVYQDTGNYLVTLVTQSGNGCGDSSSANLRIGNPAVPDMIVSPEDLCQLSVTMLEDNSQIPTGDTLRLSQWRTTIDTTEGTSIQTLFEDSGSLVLNHLVVTGTACESEEDSTLYINPKPLAAFSLNDSCLGSGASFTSTTSVFNDQNLTTTFWSFGDGNSSALNNPSHAYQDTGVYSIQLAVMTDIGCVDSITKQTRIYRKPTIAFSTMGNLCSGQSIPYIFAQEVDPNDTLSSITWTLIQAGDTTISTSVNPSLQISDTAFPTTLSIELISDAGCVTSYDTNFVVDQSPLTKISADSNCFGDFTQLRSNYSGSNYSWLWDLGDGTTSSSEEPVLFYDEAGSFQVTLQITDETNHCSKSDTDVVYVSTPLSANFPQDTLCANQTTSLRPVLVLDSIDPVSSFEWFVNGTLRSMVDSLTFIPPEGTQRVSLTVTSELGCERAFARDLFARENTLPDYELDFNEGEVPMTILYNVQNEGENQFEWILNGQRQTGNSGNFTLVDTGDYTLQAIKTNAYGCVRSATTPLSVFDERIDIGFRDLALSASAGGYELSFTAFNPTRIDITSLRYVVREQNGSALLFNESISLPTGTGLRITVPTLFSKEAIETGTFYCLEAIDVNEQSDSNPNNDQRCIANSPLPLAYAPYPNPATDLLNVPILLNSKQDLLLHVADLSGKRVFVEELSLEQGFHRIRLDVSEFAVGVYNLAVESNNEQWNYRFVVADK